MTLIKMEHYGKEDEEDAQKETQAPLNIYLEYILVCNAVESQGW